jgi:nitrile hydratase beta subunit
MNGPHDMGGFTGFGPVVAEADEPVFHAEWERRAFALVMAAQMAGTLNIDQARQARERLDPVKYWSSSYYEYRFYALIDALVDYGYITAAEAEKGHMETPPRATKRKPLAADIPAIVNSGNPSTRPTSAAAAFAIGDKVRTRIINPPSHTRLPRYAMGRAGEIVALHGAHIYPDSSARGEGEDPRWLYTVRFTAGELWGHQSSDSVCLDLWEPYLEAL